MSVYLTLSQVCVWLPCTYFLYTWPGSVLAHLWSNITDRVFNDLTMWDVQQNYHDRFVHIMVRKGIDCHPRSWNESVNLELCSWITVSCPLCVVPSHFCLCFIWDRRPICFAYHHVAQLLLWHSQLAVVLHCFVWIRVGVDDLLPDPSLAETHTIGNDPEDSWRPNGWNVNNLNN